MAGSRMTHEDVVANWPVGLKVKLRADAIRQEQTRGRVGTVVRHPNRPYPCVAVRWPGNKNPTVIGVRRIEPAASAQRATRSTPRESRLIVAALYRAIQWEESVADSWGSGTPEHAAAQAKAEEFRALLKKKGFAEPAITGTPVSVQEIARRAQETK